MAHALMVGGAEEMLFNLVRHLPSRFEPMVCCIHDAGPIGEEIRASGARVDVLGLTPGFRRPADFAGIRRYLRTVRPQIVHTFLMTASLYGRLAAILERVPVVIGTEVNIYARKLRRHIVVERALMAGTDCVIASANTVRDAYVRQIKAAAAKVEVIYNAVDWNQLAQTMSRSEMRRGLGLSPSTKVAGVIARLNEQKGHRYLFEALATRPELHDVQLLVVGDGEERGRLAAQADSLKISPRVHFLGARRDLGDLLNAMDVFVLPSLWEGLPLSLILAMGAGVPVVTTPVGGVIEVVEDGRNGLLVPPADAVSLGSAMARLFDDPRLRERLTSNASAAVMQRFGVDAYVGAIVALYDRLLQPDGKAAAHA